MLILYELFKFKLCTETFEWILNLMTISPITRMLRIHEKLSIILKTSKKCMRWWFLICKGMHILKVYSIHYTLRQNTNVKKNCFGQNKRYKNALFFLSWAPAHHSFTFNLRFLYELKHKVRLSVCGIFHFRFRFVFIKVYIFVQQNAWTLWL